MIKVEEAKEILSAIKIDRKIKTVSITESVGMFCAETIYSPIAVPSFDNSAMDGYALFFDDIKPVMEISGVVKAGDTLVEPLKSETIVRIFTGAPIPVGADTVVKQELVKIQDRQITIDPGLVKKGDFVRKSGAQCEIGQEVVKIGTKITTGTVALLASLGIAEIAVFKKPKVGVVLTGDEVVGSNEKLLPGQIYDANGPMLHTALLELGIEVEFVEKVKDEAKSVEESIKNLVEKVDILILSGGISVGDFDFVRPALQNLGAKELFYRIAQKPGKPLYAGILGSKVVFALPGNPSSSLSCFKVYVSPFIMRFCGAENTYQSDLKFPLAQAYNSDSSLTLFLKCELKEGEIHILSGQESFNLISFNRATGLVEIPNSDTQSSKGNLYNYYPF
ncbi:gephyrin-like molybdotransferase Glp [Belliella marina]|uniref:Molybdopterin molybdenumtransferase n=1 Tax=Belliella marina TaxID=1644146 RepID=A0ABW4VRP9_9BACT